MITRTPMNALEAINDRSYRDRKILVGGFDVECIRFGKIVHIQNVRRLPRVQRDGSVKIRAFNDEYEIKATKMTLDSTGQSWISFDLA